MVNGGSWAQQSPHLLWPADRAWCLATEVDVDSTLVAGDQGLVDDLLSTPGLDAWPVQPTDSSRSGADTLNLGLRPHGGSGPASPSPF